MEFSKQIHAFIVYSALSFFQNCFCSEKNKKQKQDYFYVKPDNIWGNQFFSPSFKMRCESVECIFKTKVLSMHICMMSIFKKYFFIEKINSEI